MKNLFILSEEEKNRILNLHESATKRQYLSEQEIKQGPEGDPYQYKKVGNDYFYANKNDDNWTKATKDAAINNIKNTIFSLPPNKLTNQKPEVYLLFDGTNLNWVENGKVIKRWSAISGRTKFNTFGDKNLEKLVKKYGANRVEFMKIKDQGPIPVGEYSIGQVQKRTNGDAQRFIQGKTDVELQKIMLKNIKHDWNLGTETDMVAWGNYRLPITKVGETETFGRGSFYIHGGGIPGSIGCIDLLTKMDDFANYFTNWKNNTKKNKLKLVVKY